MLPFLLTYNLVLKSSLSIGLLEDDKTEAKTCY